MSVNKVILLGNVCADPKITTFQDGGKIAQLSLATNKPGYKTKDGRDVAEQTEFHNIVINRSNLAKVAEQYIRRGNKLYIEGELRTRSYMGNDNVERYITEVYVDVLEMLTPKNNNAPAPIPDI